MANDIDLPLLSRILLSAEDVSGLPEDSLYLLIRKGALLTLEQNPTPQGISLLSRVILESSSLPIQEVAFQILEALALQQTPAAISSLFDLAVIHNHNPARCLITSKNLPAPDIGYHAAFLLLTGQTGVLEKIDPDFEAITIFYQDALPEMRLRLSNAAVKNGMGNWALIVTSLLASSPLNSIDLLTSYSLFQSAEKKLTLELLKGLSKQNNLFAQDTLCQIFIKHDDSQAREIAFSLQVSPADIIQKALFFFLAGMWHAYHSLDFDYSLISEAYLNADNTVRKRLLDISKYAGETGWFELLSGSYQSRGVSDLNDREWEASISHLKSANRFSDLWKLAQFSPPFWSGQIIIALNKAAWAPDNLEEKEGFSLLSRLSSTFGEYPPQIQQKQTLHTSSASSLCMAIDPSERNLVVGGLGSEISHWNLTDIFSPLEPICCPASISRVLAFSPDGAYLVVANGDNLIRIYNFPERNLIKTLTGHTSVVRSIVFHPDGRSFFSAGFDGKIISRRFPYGSEVNTISTNHGEIYSLGIDGSGQVLVSSGSDMKINIWKIPEATLIDQISAHTGSVTQLVTSSSGQIAVSYAKDDNTLRVWNYFSGKKLMEIHVPDQRSILTCLWMDPSEQLLFAGNNTGDIFCWSLSSGKQMNTLLQSQKQPVVSIQGLSEGKTIASAISTGTIHFWDLEIFYAIRLSLEKLEKKQSFLNSLISNPSLSSCEKAWIVFTQELIHWRNRYNIEIAMPDHIQAGEYDIEL